MQKIIILNSNELKSFLILIAFVISGNMNAQITNFGNLYIFPSANLNINGSFINTGSASDLLNSGNLQLTGDFTNNGNDFNTSGTGSVVFNGTAAQNINGTQASTFYNLTQANAGDVIIANNETVNNNLTLTSGSLSLNNNILTLNGAVTYSSGSLSATPASGLILTGAAAKNLYFKPGYHTIKDVKVNTSATNVNLGDSLHIAAGNASGALTVDGKLNTNAYLTLKSDAGGTARVAPSSGIINGKVTVERYFHAKRAWRLMTAPLKNISSPTLFDAWQLGGFTTTTTPAAPAGRGELITGAAGGIGLDQGINNNPSLKIFTSSTGALSGVSNTKVSVSPGTYATGTGSNRTGENIGYFNFVRGDRDPSNIGGSSPPNVTTLSSTGLLQTGDQVFTFPLAAGNAEKFMLVGNPYACPVDFAGIVADNPDIENKFWAWDPEAGGSGSVGAYVVYDGINGYTTPASPGGQNGDIQSGQAVYFFTTKATSASVVFRESHKSDSTVRGPLFRPMIFTTSQIAVNLKFLNADNSTILADGVLAQFGSSFSDAIDAQDGLKFPNVNESFSLMRNGKLLTIERRNTLSQSDTLFFNLSRATKRSYQLEFIAEGLETSGLRGYLEDSYLKTNIPVNLSGRTTVNFSINSDAASQAANRFRLVFNPVAAPLPVTFTNVKAYQQNAGINVEWKVENETSIKYYEVEKSLDGRTFIKSGEVAAKGNNVVSQAYNLFDAQPNKGDNYYRIKSIGTNGEYKYTSIVRVTLIQSGMIISVYPNPVKNNSVNLKFTNTIAGKYNISLYSSNGKIIFTKNRYLDTETSSLVIPVNMLVKGVYELKISSSKVTRTLKVIVE